MKIKKMTSYGIRVVARLYMAEGRVTTSTELSQKEGIPVGVLMKVLSKLRAAGIVQSHQGRGQISGGFSLNKNCTNIDIEEVLEAMEDEIELYPVCEETKYNGDFKKLYDYLKETNDTYKAVLSKCKVKDML